MTTTIRYQIIARHEGPLQEIIDARSPPTPDLAEVLDIMGQLCFLVETIAHLYNKESHMLPTATKARSMIAQLQGGELP